MDHDPPAPDREMQEDGPGNAFAIDERRHHDLGRALFAAGFATFAALYGPQPILPALSHAFVISAGQASLTLSGATGAMALTFIPASILSERVGRRPMIAAALFAAALLTLGCALSRNWTLFLVLRILAGTALAGVPALAMAFIAEEARPGAIGRVMGVYLSGAALGGMMGRLCSGFSADLIGWRGSFLMLGGATLICALVFARRAPPARHFRSRRIEPATIAARFGRLLRQPTPLRIFLAGAGVMGSYMTLFNCVGYRLAAAPYHLGSAAIGLFFLLNLPGSLASAWAGRMAARYGPARCFWIPVALSLIGAILTLGEGILLILVGLTLAALGFFGAHSIASGWIASDGGKDAGPASATYLVFYYLGGTMFAPIGALIWTDAGWPGTVIFTASLAAAALLLAMDLQRRHLKYRNN